MDNTTQAAGNRQEATGNGADGLIRIFVTDSELKTLIRGVKALHEGNTTLSLYLEVSEVRRQP